MTITDERETWRMQVGSMRNSRRTHPGLANLTGTQDPQSRGQAGPLGLHGMEVVGGRGAGLRPSL